MRFGVTFLLASIMWLAVACAPPIVGNIGGPPTGTPDPPAADATPVPHHPVGFAAPDAHGPAMFYATEDCRTCHGTTLEGAAGPSCDSCHPSGWRQNCTFCHGGTDNDTGAPPGELVESPATSFLAHTAHVTETANHSAFECQQCHVKPDDVLSLDHLFDPTPGVAEVDFTAGLSDTGSYLGAGECDSTCHGDGRGNPAIVRDTDATPACSGCHAFLTSTADEQAGMSGFHSTHLGPLVNAVCVDCHADTVDADGNILDPAKHVDGLRELKFADAAAMSRTGLACSGTCHERTHYAWSWLGTGAYHPTGFAEPAAHGLEAKVQTQDCRVCHGAQLDGGSVAVSCDTCHTGGWRQNCTFCHGGTETTGGAPPRDMDGQTTPATLSFKAHSAHVGANEHPAYGCVHCHRTPTTALSPGHTFDGTKAVAEVGFTAGLSPMGAYAGGGACSNLYCHGNGFDKLGAFTDAQAKPACDGCHASPASGAAGWATMSGSHPDHLGVSGVACADCHSATVSAAGAITGANLHVNGTKDIVLAATTGVTITDGRCTGTCHDKQHGAYAWGQSGGYHPAGFSDPGAHGMEAKLNQQDCRGCHGTDLAGGSVGVSCDSCHSSGWRTNCTYCHGGTQNLTGAPPQDIDGDANPATITFRAHDAHVTGNTRHAAFQCTQCHTRPVNATSANHMFDSTPAAAEVVFVLGLSPASTYNGTNTCSNNYCHGTGRVNGSVADGSPTPSCAGCHPAGPQTGDHGKHDGNGFTCSECHGATVNAQGAINTPANHVNGVRNVLFTTSTVTFVNNRCNGTCHGESHSNDSW